MKLGLALSGGGIKGAAHIGVLQALEEENIKVDCISGTSSGSIVAALYAAGYKPFELLTIFKDYANQIKYFTWDNIFKLFLGLFSRKRFAVKGFNNGKKVEKSMRKLFLNKNVRFINDLSIPIVIPAVGINDGTLYVFTNSENLVRNYSDVYSYKSNIDIAKCIRSSISLPGIFEPVKFDDDLLVDGAIRENFPWRELKKLGPAAVISIVFEIKQENKEPKSVIDIIDKSLGIMTHELANYELHKADLVLKIITEKISLLDTTKIDELYKIGYETAKKAISDIKLLSQSTVS